LGIIFSGERYPEKRTKVPAGRVTTEAGSNRFGSQLNDAVRDEIGAGMLASAADFVEAKLKSVVLIGRSGTDAPEPRVYYFDEKVAMEFVDLNQKANEEIPGGVLANDSFRTIVEQKETRGANYGNPQSSAGGSRHVMPPVKTSQSKRVFSRNQAIESTSKTDDFLL